MIKFAQKLCCVWWRDPSVASKISSQKLQIRCQLLKVQTGPPIHCPSESAMYYGSHFNFEVVALQ